MQDSLLVVPTALHRDDEYLFQLPHSFLEVKCIIQTNHKMGERKQRFKNSIHLELDFLFDSSESLYPQHDSPEAGCLQILG